MFDGVGNHWTRNGVIPILLIWSLLLEYGLLPVRYIGEECLRSRLLSYIESIFIGY